VPLYEYQCKKCKHKFEKIQKFSDRPIKKCPECGSPVEKVQHAPNVQFKGSGWYVTDYGGKSDKSKADGGSEKKDSASKDDTAKAADAKADERAKPKDKEKDGKSKKQETKTETKKSKD
jgi:putative FmdB family regulatory protein